MTCGDTFGCPICQFNEFRIRLHLQRRFHVNPESDLCNPRAIESINLTKTIIHMAMIAESSELS